MTDREVYEAAAGYTGFATRSLPSLASIPTLNTARPAKRSRVKRGWKMDDRRELAAWSGILAQAQADVIQIALSDDPRPRLLGDMAESLERLALRMRRHLPERDE